MSFGDRHRRTLSLSFALLTSGKGPSAHGFWLATIFVGCLVENSTAVRTTAARATAAAMEYKVLMLETRFAYYKGKQCAKVWKWK